MNKGNMYGIAKQKGSLNMKVPCYTQTLISVFILLFSVNLWAEGDIQGKSSDSTAKISAGRISAQPAPKEPTAASPQTTNALPGKKQADDSALADQAAAISEEAPQAAAISEEAPQAEQETSIATPQETKTDKTPSEAEYWISKVNQLTDIQAQTEQTDINDLYFQLKDLGSSHTNHQIS
jgi:hypothetical protein